MSDAAHPVLSVRALSRTLGDGAFTLDVSGIDLHAGEGLAVVGESGSGKSTLLGLLALALAPERAEHFVLHPPQAAPVDLAALWHAHRLETITRLRGRLIGFMPQTGLLLPFLSIGANIALPLTILGMRVGNRPVRLAQQLGIGHLLDRRPHEVSVGQRQRAALARALITAPALLLADEPTASLHPTQAANAMQLLVAAAETTRAALVVATHDEALARSAGLAVARLVSDADGSARSQFGWTGGGARTSPPAAAGDAQ
ncbi:MAG TPA: ATP-binding cassette domain-containing protein [Acetobacteraceae bacterium]|nr:ATP-binding cassette domain-containing protein [Acetobacteraceae bacterium]